MNFDWGIEFCTLSEVYGFTPSQILEFTLPQFYLYGYHANKAKVLKIDLQSLNEYVARLFGKGKPQHMEEDDPNNYMWVIKKAKEELQAQTGRKEFSLKEIWSHIHKRKD